VEKAEGSLFDGGASPLNVQAEASEDAGHRFRRYKEARRENAGRVEFGLTDLVTVRAVSPHRSGSALAIWLGLLQLCL
jgi:hypothetical protein